MIECGPAGRPHLTAGSLPWAQGESGAIIGGQGLVLDMVMSSGGGSPV